MTRTELIEQYRANHSAVNNTDGHTIGRCPTCRIAFAWKARHLRLRDAVCPACEEPLSATTRGLFRNVVWLIVPESVFPAPLGWAIEVYQRGDDRDTSFVAAYVPLVPGRNGLRTAQRLRRQLDAWLNEKVGEVESTWGGTRPILAAGYYVRVRVRAYHSRQATWWDRVTADLPFAS